MGLALSATGFEKTLHFSYGGFSRFRLAVAKAYSNKHGQLYEKLVESLGYAVDDDFLKQWDTECDEGLDLLLWHSDCDGKLTPSECTKLKNSLLKLNIMDEEYKDVFEDFIKLLKHCSKRRVILYFC